MSDYKPIATPCIGVCRIGEDELCTGCLRTVDEISYWRLYTEDEREQAWQRVRERRAERGLAQLSSES